MFFGGRGGLLCEFIDGADCSAYWLQVFEHPPALAYQCQLCLNGIKFLRGPVDVTNLGSVQNLLVAVWIEVLDQNEVDEVSGEVLSTRLLI